MFWLIIGLLTLVFCFIFFGGITQGPINRVYQVPGIWYTLKFRLMSFVIGRRQKKTRGERTKKDDLMKSSFGGGGKRDIKEMESKHRFPDGKEWAADAVFFNASNSDGWYLTIGTAQRPKDIINLFFVLRVPGVGTFVNEDLVVDTNVPSIESGDSEWRTKSGFVVKCVIPMKLWKFSFNGNLIRSPGLRYFKEVGPEKAPANERFPAEIELDWINFGDHFDFDTEVSPISIAHSLAIEPWSRDLFRRLQDSHQTHYEQFGHFSGRISVNGHNFENLSMTSMRDHTITSFRRWSDIRRYIMMIYHLTDGTCIHTSLISMPETVFSHLEFGYVVLPDKRNVAVDRIWLHLSHIGEGKRFPQRFEYSFDAGALHFDVKVNLLESCSFKMGLEQKCQVNENLAEFEVNGVKGYGFVEAEYRIEPY